MPQMAPIKWLTLFLIFSISFMIFNMMNYYLYTPIMPNLMKKTVTPMNTFNWKW